MCAHTSQPVTYLKNILDIPQDLLYIISQSFLSIEIDVLNQVASGTVTKESSDSEVFRKLSAQRFILKSGNGYKLASPHDFLGNFILFHRDSIEDKYIGEFDRFFSEGIFEHHVVTYEEARLIAEEAPGYWVIDCVCRVLNQNCGHPRKVCMGLAKTYQFEGARQISKSEALDVIKSAEESNLAATFIDSDNGDGWFCFCCGCCCVPVRQFISSGKSVVRGKFKELTDHKLCTACGDCVEVCQFSARSIVENDIFVNEGLCTGCGICVDDCSAQAISLIPRGNAFSEN